MNTGVETKVAAGSFTAALTGILTWVLVTFIPYFHKGLPPDLAAIIPAIAGWAGASIAGWAAPHTPRAVATALTAAAEAGAGAGGARGTAARRAWGSKAAAEPAGDDDPAAVHDS